MRKIIFFLLTAFILFNIYSCGKVEGDFIKVGAYMPLTGDFSTFGESTVRGINIAINEINRSGGLLGKKIKLIIEDTMCKPDGAAQAVQKLISQDKVLVVLGEIASSNSLAAAPICQRSRVPMISPSSTNPKVTEVGDYIFRVCFIDTFQGEVMAKFAAGILKAKTAVLLIDNSSDYSKGLSDFFKKNFLKLGGKVIAAEFYMQGDKDFTGQLTKIKALKPDVIFIPGYYNEAGLIAQQARQLGITQPLLGGDGWDSPKLIEIGGTAIENSYFSNHYNVEGGTPEVKKYVDAYKSKYNITPDSLSALGYDAAMIMADAIKRAGKLDSKLIRDALAATKNFPGLTGNITIDKQRNAKKSAVVLMVKNGKLKYSQTINP
ncbi:MAG: ABC transporter substrate-binding protein [Armatimonadetes bacterium]|nr:ABC transporter substrate-binding protein [Armatimonadota bacterium]